MALSNINNSSTNFRVSKPSASISGNGTTHKIREQLNFKDDKKWKQFSSRRLELIDRFGLSNKKASEQDYNIKQIATILRTEFNYPVSSASEFEKLVTAAVQSVRRNRKRSKKKFPTNHQQNPSSSNSSTSLESSTTPSDDDHSSNRIMSPLPTPTPSLTPVLTPMHSNITPALPNSSKPFQLPSIQPKSTTMSTSNSVSSIIGSQTLESNNKFQPKPLITTTSANSQSYNDIIKSIIFDIVNNTIPLTEQSKNDNSNAPNLTDFALSTQDHHLLSLGLHKTQSQSHPQSQPQSKSQSFENSSTNSDKDLPFFLREKVLLHIQRSRTCSEIASSQGSIELYTNLELLGEMSIKSSVSFVVERFFSNLLPSSMEYITLKTMSSESLSMLSVKLFNSATNKDLLKLPADNVQLKVLYLLLGGIVKDFGFDPVLYPLSEIIHHNIMKNYPLVTKEGSNYTTSDQTASQRTVLLSTTSMKPQIANQDVNRKIIIKFQERQQLFTFPLLSNGTPTVSEILENCKSLFNIVLATDRLGIYHNNLLIVEDNDLVKLFNTFPTTNEIVLEVKEKDSQSSPNVSKPVLKVEYDSNPAITSPIGQNTPLDGLSMLSAVSLQINKDDQNSLSTSSTSSVSTTQNVNQTSSISKLDNIISRMSNSPVINPSNKPVVKSSFQNGLPQPIFQPLL
ncbi:hypothetical protein Kpol_1066p52 [Vanderwaltozyma polyspora DSM 70294]|uniref:Transcription factor VHR1 n=1 Tax=Vanderwaltozyma polyspora (strain ATCC 22028 / DSM 70294 / BCRC 21397 / CBS 2163 / NBRC 10782 / NRRL Y-8283 / UCD 57-17) TaxID=436907 RepID=A7TMS0_VANPO|nr:uncharacterized protein Kpol_1066p52 [Vanderwaltozyma polyspora DSM 70294]EDO16484.1 hypothetical protein Kpol_1066p52 [Vanderwaltozyma polyspora DSM 70294]